MDGRRHEQIIRKNNKKCVWHQFRTSIKLKRKSEVISLEKDWRTIKINERSEKGWNRNEKPHI